MNTTKTFWKHHRDMEASSKDNWCKVDPPAWLETEFVSTVRSVHPNEPSDVVRSFGTLQQAQYHQAAMAQAAAMAQTVKLVENEDKIYPATDRPLDIESQTGYERRWTLSASDQDYAQRTPLITNTTGVHETETSMPTLQESALGVDVFRKKRVERTEDMALNGLSQLHISIHDRDDAQHKSIYPYQMSGYSSNHEYQTSVSYNHLFIQDYLSSQTIKHDILDSGKYHRGYVQSQKENTVYSLADPYVNYTSTSKHFFKEPLNKNYSLEYHEVVKRSMYPYYSMQNSHLPKDVANVQSTTATRRIFQNTASSAIHYESKISQKKYHQEQVQPFEYIEDIFYPPQNYYKNSMFVPQQTYTGSIAFTSNLSNPTKRHNEKYQTLRSPLLEEFRNNKTKKYELKDIFGHIVEFSGDQHGSRFIQQALEIASIEDRETVFQEIFPSSLQLMADVFGNYVIQKFIEYGNQAQKTLLLERMKGWVNELKFLRKIDVLFRSSFLLPMIKNQYANYVIKKALDVANDDQRNQLVSEIKPHLQFLKKNVHGKALSSNIERLITLSNNQSHQNDETTPSEI
ncbi:hypothetical protein PCK2_000002 [Pneumocystis canis]|nr:hypothetical protein PCK2_000002 [Pneumocystis canis]